MKYIYNSTWTENDIFEVAKELEGMYLKDVDLKGWLTNTANKGKIGNMIQSDFFGIPANSNKKADFHDIELKATPILSTRSGLSSKERLVISMINYMEDYKHTFYESSVYIKSKKF